MSRKRWQSIFSVLALLGLFLSAVSPAPVIAASATTVGQAASRPIAAKPAAQPGAINVVYPLKADVSPALRNIPPKAVEVSATREMPALSFPKVSRATPDQTTVAPDKAFEPNMPAPLANFEGIHNTYGVQPPDTQGDVGPNHYVEWVNLGFQIWDKDGNSLYGPANGNTLWTGFGGACETSNDGDPITLYDPMADRWFMSQFALPNFPNSPFYQCIAISQTPDPTGAWYRYAYQIPVNKMNDYPKFGVWPDAYYMSVNQFNGGALNWGGLGVAAFERQQMLLGNPAARMIFIDVGAVTLNYGGVLPADLDGPPNGLEPPANAPGLFLEWDDSTWMGDPSDMLRVWEFHADWTNPANSTFGTNANYDPNFMIPTDNVDPDMCGGSRNCIPQPGTSNRLDAISDRLMYRLQYRNFGGYKTLVANHTVDVGSDHAGIHWFELHDTGSGWTMYQQGVYAPDTDHRWMGSAALDHTGNLAVGYSISGASTYPSIRYAGRLVGDPLGSLAQGEATLVAGTGSQTSFSNRWGDYSMLSVDPTDDCTFWYTQEYYQANGSDWRTRVGSFKFPNCSVGPTGTLNGAVTDSATTLPINGAQVTASSSPTQTFGTTTNASGAYEMIIPTGTYTVTASAFGYVPETVGGVSVLSGTITTQDFALDPAPAALVQGVVTDDNTGWPLYASITIDGYPGDPVWTNPETGAYSITLPYGSYTFHAQAFYPGYLQGDAVVNVTGPTTQNFALDVDANACNAPGYELSTVLPALLEDGFEGAVFPPTGWGVYETGDTSGPGWQRGTTGTSGSHGDPHTGTYFAWNNDDNLSSDAINWLVTPQLSIPAGGADLIFWQRDYYSSYYQYHGVWVTTGASPDPAVSTFTELWTGDTGDPWVQQVVSLDAYAGQNVYLAFRYEGDYMDEWYLDDVSVVERDCAPQNGGLVIGNVYDANTALPLVGAAVASDDGGNFTTLATPADPNLDDGFYYLFVSDGTHDVTASLGAYQPVTTAVGVVHFGVVRQDFNLPAGWLSYAPGSLDVTLVSGQTTTRQVTLENQGSAAASFELKELDKGVEPLGPFEQPLQVVKPFRQNFLSTSGLPNMPPPPDAQPWAAGGVLQSWPTGLVLGWGLGYDLDASDVWVGDVAAAGGTDLAYRYLLDGTNTGDTIDISWSGVFAADFTYNQNTGTLWAMDVGGDNCIHELDPVSQVPTGNTICPTFGISQRGLAYDPSTDTYFAGGWNDLMIYRFASDGTMLQSVNVGLATAGLAYNPDTQHLFVMVNDDPNPVYVLDAANNFAVLGSFNVSAGFGAYAGAGMEFDCEGNLWAVDQATQTVYQFESGETTSMCTADVPWLSESPITGTIGTAGNQVIDVGFDAGAVTQPGVYHAQLKIAHDTPYVVANLPVTLTVTAPPTWGKLEGVVTGLGYCDSNPAPLEGATVVIVSASKTYTVTTDAAGHYQWYLDAAESPLSLSVTADGHEADSAAGVVVTAGGTTTMNFNLRWLQPCVSTSPTSFDVTLVQGYSSTLTLGLANDGAAGTNFAFSEVNVSGMMAQAYQPPAMASTTAQKLPGEPKALGERLPVAPLGEVLLNQPPNASNGLFADTACDFCGGSQSIAENFALPDGAAIGQVVIWSGYYPGDVPVNPDHLTVIFHKDSSGLPGAALYTEANVAYERVQTGATLFGVHEWMHTLTLSTPVILPAGNYWIEIYNNTGAGTDDFFWETGDLDAVYGLPGSAWTTSTPGSSWNYDSSTELAIQLVTADLDVPWLSEEPVTGTLGADSSTPIQVTFDSMTYTVGAYTALLKVKSNDPVNSTINIPVTMTVVGPTYSVVATPTEAALSGAPGTTVTYTLHITNTGNVPNTFNITAFGDLWDANIPVSSIALDPGEGADFVVGIAIPASADGGDMDDATINITGAGGASAAVNLTTTAQFIKIYLPIIMRAFAP